MGSLQNITVLDLTRLLPGPFATMILSQQGARVIKVEDPQRGDYLRDFPPHDSRGDSVLFDAFNRGKESVVLDLGRSAGKKVFSQLVRRADVLVESFRPGVLKRLGFSFEQIRRINPHLVIASISGYGQKGKRKDLAGHDVNYLSLAGLVKPTAMPVLPWADLVGGGLWTVLQIQAALLQRHKTKKGALLDVSMTDVMVFLGTLNQLTASFPQIPQWLQGVVARYRLYETGDGRFVAFAPLEDKFWEIFLRLVGWKDENVSLLDTLNPEWHRRLEALFRSKSLAEWTLLGKKHDICLTPVLLESEVVSKQKTSKKAPRRGQQTLSLLKEMGYTPLAIKRLVADRTVGVS